MAASTVIAIIALVVAVVSLSVSWYINITRPREIYQRLPEPELYGYDVIEQSPTIVARFLLRNAGPSDAHDFRFHVPYPPGVEINKVEAPDFAIVDGGEGKQFVTLGMGLVRGRSILPMVSISATARPKIDGVSVWCMEQRGMVSLPAFLLR